MHIGVCMFATDYAIRADELARAAEERGFESLWVPEHTHIPVSRRTPFPGGAQLPKEYSHTNDPFVSLMAAGPFSMKWSIMRVPAASRSESATTSWTRPMRRASSAPKRSPVSA